MAEQDRLSASGQAEYGSRTATGGMGITREPENQWEAAGPTQLLWAGPGLVPWNDRLHHLVIQQTLV